MFVLRSAFWLTVGFFLVAPHGTDFGAAAATIKNQAVSAGIEAGQQLIISQVTTGGRLPDLLLSSSKTVDVRLSKTATASSVFPRPRPPAMG